MIGEDAVSVYTQLLMKFVDLLAKLGEEKRTVHCHERII